VDKVKRLMEAGADIPTAIKTALGMQLIVFADKYEIPRTSANEAINGVRRPSRKVIDALIAELGGTELEWRYLLWEAARPAQAPPAAPEVAVA
jgi:hypothetical protein